MSKKIEGKAPVFEVVSARADENKRQVPVVALRILDTAGTLHEWDMSPEAARDLATEIEEHLDILESSEEDV